MNWPDILMLVTVLGVATFFVWRSSGTNSSDHHCGCGCHHDHAAETTEDEASS